MPAVFYILRCADGTYYVGHTTDLPTWPAPNFRYALEREFSG